MYFLKIIEKSERIRPDLSLYDDVDRIIRIGIESYFNLSINIRERYLGTHHFVYRFSFQGSDQEYMAKIPNRPKSHITIEYQVLKLLGKKGVLCAEYVHLINNKQFGDILICSKAKGKPLRDMRIDTSIRYYDTLNRIAGKIKELHAVDFIFNGYGVVNLAADETLYAESDSWIDFLYSTSDEEIELLKRMVNGELCDKIEEYLTVYYTKIKSRSFRPSILHGDLSSKNIFAEDNNISLIDFEDVIIGDPLFDIANFLSFYKMNHYFNFFVKCYDPGIRKNSTGIILFYYLRIMIAKLILTYKMNDDSQIAEGLKKINFVLDHLRSF